MYFFVIVDFLEGMSIVRVCSYVFIVIILVCIIGFGLSKIFFWFVVFLVIFNLLLFGFSFILVFMVLKMNDFEFKNGDV